MAQPGAFAQVVGFGVQLLFGFGQQRSNVQAFRQQTGNPEQGGDVIDIAVDALADAGVLHLDRQVSAVFGPRGVNLADRGRCHRGEGKALKMLIPTFAPMRIENDDQLAHRHRVRVRTQAGQNFAQFRRQQVAGIHRHQLPYFHRCAAQLGQLIGDAAGVGRGQQQIAHARPFALGKLAHAFRQHATGNAGGQTTQFRQP